MLKEIFGIRIGLFLFAIILFSCKKDSVTSPSSNANFSNQSLAGMIDGKSKTFAGYAFKTGTNFNELNITFSDTTLNGNCSYYLGNGKDVVTFTLDNKTGSYALGSSTVTFIIGKTKQWLVATNGTIELTAIDTTAKTVIGKMNVKFNDQNYVNGNFSVNMCN